jgi:hypothetical protein
MEHGANLDPKNIHGHTALDTAICLKRQELVRVFSTHLQAQNKLREAIAQKAQEKKKKEEKEEKRRMVERAEQAVLAEEAFLVELEAEIKEEDEKRKKKKKEKSTKKKGGKKSEGEGRRKAGISP